MRGRKPKPTVLRAIEGNPGKRPLNDREPKPPEGTPDCPEYLDEHGKAEWFRLVPILKQMRVFTEVDRTALAAYCTAFSRWIHAEAQVKKYGTIVKSPEKGFPMKSPYLCVASEAMEAMRKFMVEFGLTPSSRSRLRVPDQPDAAREFDIFLETG